MKMENRILVTYATKAGSTADVAERIAKNLSDQNLPVELLPVSKAGSLEQYTAVVVGSAVRAGNLLPEAKSFIDKHQAELANKHFSFFVVCLTMKDETEENCKTVSAYLDPVRAKLKPAREGFFAGRLNASRLGFVERMLMKAMKAPDGDYINGDAIDEWSRELGRELSAASVRS
jgi:menaquinone-dependent protoporphyrinogen oxidase